MTAWRPIETAPTSELILGWDGRTVMSVIIDSDGSHTLRPKGRSGMCMHCDEYGFAPTHWQPLPEPPVAEGEVSC